MSEHHGVVALGRDGQLSAAMSAHAKTWEGSVKTNPLRSGANPHRSARLTTTKTHSEDVVDWLHDASQRLLEARLARARDRNGPRQTH